MERNILVLVVVAALLAVVSAMPGWICPQDSGPFNPGFCNTGRSLTRLEIGFINRIFGTDKTFEEVFY